MDNFEAVRDMARRQESLHIQILGDNWRERQDKAPWMRAAWMECAELMRELGWEWHQESAPNIAQARMEAVDIWHFLLSDALCRRNPGAALAALAECLPILPPTPTLGEGLRTRHPGETRRVALNSALLAVEHLAQGCLNGAPNAFTHAFAALLRHLEMSAHDLYAASVAKHALNLFRQDHGYRTGNYDKTWGGKSDTEHLVKLMTHLEGSPLTLPEIHPQPYQDALRLSLEALYLNLGGPLAGRQAEDAAYEGAVHLAMDALTREPREGFASDAPSP